MATPSTMSGRSYTACLHAQFVAHTATKTHTNTLAHKHTRTHTHIFWHMQLLCPVRSSKEFNYNFCN